jgi:hypothetical protein
MKERVSGFFPWENLHLKQFKRLFCLNFLVFLGGKILPNFPARNIVCGKILQLSTHFSLLGQFLASFLQF